MTIAKTAGFTPAAGESSPHAGAKRAGVSPGPRRRITATRGPVVRAWGDKLAAGAVGLVLCGFIPATASAAPSAPCAKHVGEKRVACLKYRARQPYPSRPTWADFRSRATPYEYDTLHRIARCEMGEGPRVKGSPWRVRFGLVLPRYSSAFGIWNGNFTYTRAATGYDWPTSVPAEEAFHALALARRYGFSAWSCF